MSSSWTTYSGTITGPHHTKRNQPNQDAYGFRTSDEASVIVVADGAGSLPRSEYGANLTVTQVLEAFDQHSESMEYEELIRHMISSARERLLAEPESHELGCTLTIAIVGSKGWSVGGVGDSFAIVHETPEVHSLLVPPSVSEWANITRLLTSKNMDEQVWSGTDTITGISVATDGLFNTTTEANEPVQNFWAPIITRALHEELDVDGLLQYMDSRQKIDDDTTLVTLISRN